MEELSMLNIEKKQDGKDLTVALTGRLDTVTAPELESELASSLDDVENLVIDMTDLEYISSAGLRVLLTAQKTMNQKGSMKLINVNETVMEIFDVTGFVDILTIE
jgi:anti-sigma B factor antagonist